jgi:hypothetical protein
MITNSKFRKLLGKEYTLQKWANFIKFCLDNQISIMIHEPEPIKNRIIRNEIGEELTIKE